MKSRIVALLGAVIVLIAVAGISVASAGKGKVTSAAESAGEASADLRDAVTVDGVTEHLDQLQEIADDNDGNRASGFSGFDDSVKYVQQTLKAAGWSVKTQPFDFSVFFLDAPTVFEQTAPTATTYAEDKDFNTMDFSGSGEATSELVAVDLTIPPPTETGSTSGCEAADFNGLDVTGKIALMQRGTCDFAVKVENAAAAGAAGSIIFNEGQEGRTDIIDGALGEFAKIPAVDTSFELGSKLANSVANGPTGITVHLKTTTHAEQRTARNIIAETPGGDPKHVVFAGAHLDSVVAGPGINDNGTGSATLLEIAQQISDLGVEPRNKIRLAWWAAEEEGLVGSTGYVGDLSKAAAKKIALYLNFDMLGSPNFTRLIYDGDGSAFDAPGPKGSDAIEANYEAYFEEQNLPTGETPFDGRSDYGPFNDVGIPSGGLFSGAEELKTKKEQKLYGGKAGKAQDACYHQACDTTKNVSKKSLDPMADAVADSIMTYAFDLKALKSGSKRPVHARAAAQGETEYLGDALRR